MDATIPYYSNVENKVKYFYDINQTTYCLIHPLLLYYYLFDDKLENEKESIVLDSFDDIEKKYYKEKYLFLKSNGFFSQINYQNDISNFLTENTVLELIKNLNQIVFEVTDKCNLHCTYCAYGELYNDYDKRDDKMMPFKIIQNTIDYLKPILSQTNDILYVSFYGGEPLLNMDVIKMAVEYLKKSDLNRKICYTMTTNGILLDKYIDFLSENKFKILVSIDGDYNHNSYRVFHSGKSSFDKLFTNLKLIKEKYPQYFVDNIEFNTVLHNRNSIEGAHHFLYKEFGKVTTIAPLDNSGIIPEKLDQFKKMYHDIGTELAHIEDKESLINQQIAKNPIVNDVALFLKTLIKYTDYEFYEDILAQENLSNKIPTGTCFPFQKKMFITVNGKILACERIDQKYTLGNVNMEKVEIDYVEITQKYNDYFSKIKSQCVLCYKYETCTQCLFQIDDFLQQYKCPNFFNKERFSNYLARIISSIEETPTIITKIIKEVYLK